MSSNNSSDKQNGYQPELSAVIGKIVPPHTGSHVKMPEAHCDRVFVPKSTPPRHDDSILHVLEASKYANLRKSTQDRIREITNSMQDLLLYKNQKYGDSAIHPNKVFYKGDSTNSILIRLDDKLGRVKANTEDKPRVNDVCDIIGYCTLLLISMGVTKEDIEKFKD